MAYSALALANAFIGLSQHGKIPDLSPMKLQRLMFFAQAWHLHAHREALMDDTFCRWTHGPVVPSLYHRTKHLGSASMTDFMDRSQVHDGRMMLIRPTIPNTDRHTWNFLDEIVRSYGRFTGPELSRLVDEDGRYQKNADGSPILNQDLACQIGSKVGAAGGFSSKR